MDAQTIPSELSTGGENAEVRDPGDKGAKVILPVVDFLKEESVGGCAEGRAPVGKA